MNDNILRTKDCVKIYINYVNSKGLGRKKQVTVRYVDLSTCYLTMPLPSDVERPKPKSKAELVVYTTDGVYNSEVVLLGTEVTLNEFFYEVSLPKTWNYKQLRNGSRKDVELPLTLKFDDGFEVTATSTDLSVGGLSFKTEQRISTIYHKLKCQLTLQLPKDLLINFADGKFICSASFVRLRENFETNEKIYAFQFLNVSKEDSEILQNYLLHLI
ncbi:MAG: PilZ domain-containing protein [bacterium]|nr:PilZ domain-containing protein [bacterium]